MGKNEKKLFSLTAEDYDTEYKMLQELIQMYLPYVAILTAIRMLVAREISFSCLVYAAYISNFLYTFNRFGKQNKFYGIAALGVYAIASSGAVFVNRILAYLVTYWPILDIACAGIRVMKAKGK